MSIISDITFQQIAAFLTIARHKKLSGAAEQMFITQPALSRTLSRFEANIGRSLFERSSKGVKLTHEGEYLFSVLAPLYKIVEQSLNEVGDGISTTKTLRLVMPVIYDDIEDFDVLKELVNIYRQRYPFVEIDETYYPFDQLRQQLEFGSADFVFSQDYILEALQNISYRYISPYNMWIAISAACMVDADMIDLEWILEKPLLMIPKGMPTDKDISLALVAFHQMGLSPKSIEIVPNYPTLINKIRQGKGYSVCGRFKNISPDDIRFYQIPLDVNPCKLVVAWRNDRIFSEETKNFVNLLPKEQGK